MSASYLVFPTDRSAELSPHALLNRPACSVDLAAMYARCCTYGIEREAL